MSEFLDEYSPVDKLGINCPICGKPDWCCVRRDGKMVLCQREKSDRRYGDAGWRHNLGENGLLVLPPFGGLPATHAPKLPTSYMRMVAEHAQHVADTDDILDGASDLLGLERWSLLEMGLGYSRQRRALCFPMYDAYGDVVGIRYRTAQGKKFSFKGGKNGVFHRTSFPDQGEPTYLIVEGPTDCAAGLMIEFPNTIGRPGCNIGTQILQDMNLPFSDIIILADNDKPGRLGATELQQAIGGFMVMPRIHKDLRDMVQTEDLYEIRGQLMAAAFHRHETSLFIPL